MTSQEGQRKREGMVRLSAEISSPFAGRQSRMGQGCPVLQGLWANTTRSPPLVNEKRIIMHRVPVRTD